MSCYNYCFQIGSDRFFSDTNFSFKSHVQASIETNSASVLKFSEKKEQKNAENKRVPKKQLRSPKKNIY